MHASASTTAASQSARHGALAHSPPRYYLPLVPVSIRPANEASVAHAPRTFSRDPAALHRAEYGRTAVPNPSGIASSSTSSEPLDTSVIAPPPPSRLHHPAMSSRPDPPPPQRAPQKRELNSALMERYLDENQCLLQAIMEAQNHHRIKDAVAYQQQLQQNLLYLVALAEIQRPNALSSLPPLPTDLPSWAATTVPSSQIGPFEVPAADGVTLEAAVTVSVNAVPHPAAAMASTQSVRTISASASTASVVSSDVMSAAPAASSISSPSHP